MALEFGIVGALGRMGRTIATLAAARGFKLSAAVEHPLHPDLGKNYRAVTGIPFDCTITPLSAALVPAAGFIDFSHAATVAETLDKAAAHGVPVVVGTTGFSKEEKHKLESYATRIPLVIAANMAIGVNVLFALVAEAARALSGHGFDPEILEIHHNRKKDAPSGTALVLQDILLAAYGFGSESVRYGREGMVGERKRDELGVMALRGGDVVGDHTVYFLGQGERIEIRHQATSRDTFAFGALAALQFLQGKAPGLYTMQQVLGLAADKE
ncbi:MAG: 4-hydroxy-tetrahydrodipicolinate reductase [Turneriella sp.]|nr:4-hydroxy-tetrahydrodipicolinate reductase [Turneriella sp.]